jgi:hypothetical protein
MSRADFKETKAASFVAYDGVRDESWQFPDGKVWTVTRTWHSHITGFKSLLLTCSSRPFAILAFAGTDSVVDAAVDIHQALGGIPPQYTQALVVASRAQQAHRSNLHLCGHSLGGGLAAFCSVHMRLPASTVNPAPLMTTAGLSGWFGSNRQITNYIAGGSEVVSSAPGRNPGVDVAVPATGNFFSRHSLANTDPSIPLPKKV